MSEISLTTYYFLYVECGMTREEIYSSLYKNKSYDTVNLQSQRKMLQHTIGSYDA